MLRANVITVFPLEDLITIVVCTAKVGGCCNGKGITFVFPTGMIHSMKIIKDSLPYSHT